MWNIFKDIKDLPSGIWDRCIAHGDVCLGSRLISVVQKIYNGHIFHYYAKMENGVPEILFMTMTGRERLTFTGHESICVTAMMATPETSGRHYWYDREKYSFGEFLSQAEQIIRSTEEGVEALLVNGLSNMDVAAEQIGWSYMPDLPVSRLTVDAAAVSLEEHIASLNYKRRYQIKQYREAVAGERYLFEAVEDFLPEMDELYPLYAEVVERSSEYVTEPYTPEYFSVVKNEFGDDAVMITVKDVLSGEYLGFMMLLYSKASCVHQYIGFHRREELFLWHNLTLESIGHSISKGVRLINMGVTNAVAKHKFGAKSYDTYSVVKFIGSRLENGMLPTP